jgi:hypothetical protein
VEDQAYEERDSTTDIEGAGGGTRYDDVYEEGMSDADIAAEIADLGKESELVDAVLNTAASIMAMNSKKVVLAFNEQLLGLTSGKVKTLIQLLAKVKDKKSLGIFLEDLVIIPEYHYSSGDGDDAGDTGTLENRLNAMGIEDVNDPERYAIFTFDPMDIQPPNAGSYAAVRNVRIDEDSKFDPEVNYYPIFEMVAITLYWHKYGLPVDEIVRILRGKGFVGENFNLPLESIQDNFYFISFYVMPPMSGEAVEDISRNDRIIKALDSAA